MEKNSNLRIVKFVFKCRRADPSLLWGIIPFFHLLLHLGTAVCKLSMEMCFSLVSYNSQVLWNQQYCLEACIPGACYPHSTVTTNKSRFSISLYVTFMHSRAARFASCVSVDGPLIPDCSVPLRVSQLTKLSTVDSPLQIRRHQHQWKLRNHIILQLWYKKDCLGHLHHSPVRWCLLTLQIDFAIRIHKVFDLEDGPEHVYDNLSTSLKPSLSNL